MKPRRKVTKREPFLPNQREKNNERYEEMHLLLGLIEGNVILWGFERNGFAMQLLFFFCHFVFGNRDNGILSLSWDFIKGNFVFSSQARY